MWHKASAVQKTLALDTHKWSDPPGSNLRMSLFILSVCVFSSSLPPSLHCRFIPGPNGAVARQLRVPGSSPHPPFLLPPNRLKLLQPRLLTGLPGTTERISTQIKRALLMWCQGFETRLIPFDQWAPCWWLSSTTLLRPVSDLFVLSLFPSSGLWLIWLNRG